MADLFDIISSEPTVEVIPPNKVRPLRLITARSKPSGVVYFFAVRPPDFVASHVNLIAHDIAQALNKLADKPGVIDITMEQSVNPTDTVGQKVIVTVESTSGDSSGDVTLTWSEMFGADGYKKVATTRTQLDAIEGL